MNKSVCCMCGLQNTDISEMSAAFFEEAGNASSELHLRHLNSLNSVCKCNKHLKENQTISSLKCLDRGMCSSSIKEEPSETSLKDIELAETVSIQQCSAVLNSPSNVHQFSESPEEASSSHKQFRDVKAGVEDKDQFHEKTPGRCFVDGKMTQCRTDNSLGTCAVSALTDESLDGEIVMSPSKNADKENSLQCNLKASLHHDSDHPDLEINEHTSISKQQGLSSQGKSKVANHLHHNSKDQFDISKDTWQSIRKTSNKYARVKAAPVSTKNFRNCKRSSGVRINDFDNQCDVVNISQPITECHFETQRSIISSKKTARKSTRGYFFNGECCELSTVRTLFHGSKTGEIVNCSKLMKETLVFQKQTLSNNLSRMQITAVASPGIVDFSIMPVACVLQGSPYSEDKTDDPKLEFETCDSNLLMSRNSSPGPISTLCSQVSSESTNQDTSITFQCSSISLACSVKDEDYRNLVKSAATETTNLCAESSNEKASEEGNIQTVFSVLEKDFFDFSAVSKEVSSDEINSDPYPSNPHSVNNSECSEISKSISFLNVPSSEISSDPYPGNTNLFDKSACPEMSTSVSFLDVPSCEINIDSCPSNTNSGDKSECPEISTSVSFMDMTSCEINIDPGPSNVNSVDDSECPEISTSVSFLDVPSCEINSDPCSTNANSVDKSECPEMSTSVSFLDAPSCEINSELGPGNVNSLDKSECPEISTSVSFLDPPSCEINIDPCPSNVNSVDKSECPEIATSVFFLDVPSSDIKIDPCPSNVNPIDKLDCPEIFTSVSFLDVPSCELYSDPCSSNLNLVDNLKCPEIARSLSSLDSQPCEIHSDPCPSNQNSVAKSECAEIPRPVSFLDDPACEIYIDQCPIDSNSVDNSECSENSRAALSLDVLPCKESLDHRFAQASVDSMEEDQNSVPKCNSEFEKSYFVQSTDCQLLGIPTDANEVETVDPVPEFLTRSLFYEHPVDARLSICMEEAYEDLVDGQSALSEGSYDEESIDFKLDLSLEDTPGKDPVGSRDELMEQDEHTEVHSEVRRCLYSEEAHELVCNGTTSPFENMSDFKSVLATNMNENVSCTDISLCVTNGKEMLDCIENISPSDSFYKDNSESLHLSPSTVSVKEAIVSRPGTPSLISDSVPLSHTCASLSVYALGEKPIDLSSKSHAEIPIKSPVCSISASPKTFSDEAAAINVDCVLPFEAYVSADNMPASPLMNAIGKGSKSLKPSNASENSFKSTSMSNKTEKMLASYQGKQKKHVIDKLKMQKCMKLKMSKAKSKMDDSIKSFVSASSSNKTEKQLDAEQGKESKKSLNKSKVQKSVNLDKSKAKSEQDSCKESLGNTSCSNETKKCVVAAQGKGSKLLNTSKIEKSINLVRKGKGKQVDRKKSLANTSIGNKTDKHLTSDQGKKIKKLINEPEIPKSVSLDTNKNKCKGGAHKNSFASTSSGNKTDKQLTSDQGKKIQKLINEPEIPKSVSLDTNKNKSKGRAHKNSFASTSSGNKTDKQLTSDQGKKIKKLINEPKIPKSVSLDTNKNKSKGCAHKNSFASTSSGNKTDKQLTSDQAKKTKKLINEPEIPKSVPLDMNKNKGNGDAGKNSFASSSSGNKTDKPLIADQGKTIKKLINEPKIQKSVLLKTSKNKSKQDAKKKVFASASNSDEAEKQLASDQVNKMKKLLNKPKIPKNTNLEINKSKGKRYKCKSFFMTASSNNETEKQRASGQGEETEKLINKPKCKKSIHLAMSKDKSKQDELKKSFVSANSINETKKQLFSDKGKERKELVNEPKCKKSVNLEMCKGKSKHDGRKKSFVNACSSDETEIQPVSNEGRKSKKLLNKSQLKNNMNLEMNKDKSKQGDRKKSVEHAGSINETEKQLISNQSKESKKFSNKPNIKKNINFKMRKCKSKQNDLRMCFESTGSSTETEKQQASNQSNKIKTFSNEQNILESMNLEVSKAKSKQSDHNKSVVSLSSNNETENQQSFDQVKEIKLTSKSKIQKSCNLVISKAKSLQDACKKSDNLKKSNARKKILKRKKKKKGQPLLLKSDRCLRSQDLLSKADSSMEISSASGFQVPGLKINLVKSPGLKRFQRRVHIHKEISVHFTVDCFNRNLLGKMQDVGAEVFENSVDEFPVIKMPSCKSIKPQMIADGDRNWSVSESGLLYNHINQAESLQIMVDMNSSERKVQRPKPCTDIFPGNIDIKSSNVTTQDLKSGKSKPIINKYEKNDLPTSSQTFLTTRSGKKPMLPQTIMKQHKKRILRNRKLRFDSTLAPCTKSHLLTEGSLLSMEEKPAHSTKVETASTDNPLNVNKDLPENNKEICRSWFSEEVKQKHIADFNAKYLEVQKRWILLEKDLQPVHKVKNKSDKLKEIWRTKKRVRKARHYSEATTLSPVQVLFMKTFKLSNICKWFLETTETKSLVIVKKVSSRLPDDFPLTALPIQRYPSSIVYPPSAQAERLKKHLKKFASASPIKSNTKTQRMFAQCQDTFDSDSDKFDSLSTDTVFDVVNDVANGKSSQSLKPPESVRILRKYSSIREKLKGQHCLLESEINDRMESKDEHCQKGICVNPLISSNLVLQVQTGESWNKTESTLEGKRGMKRPRKCTKSDTKLDKKKKLHDNLSSTLGLSSSSLKVEPLVEKASNKDEQNDFLKIIPSTRNQASLLCMSKVSEKPSLKGKTNMANKLVHKKSGFLLKGNIKKSKRKMANIELLLMSTKIKKAKRHSCTSRVKGKKEPPIAKTQTRSMKRAELQNIIMQKTKLDPAAHTKRRHPVTK